jgi:predicted dehydrogenase
MDKITRRRFLEQSLLTAAALAGAGRIGEAEAAARHDRRRIGPNDKIYVACIGVHGRGRDHIGAFAGRNDVEIVAICDVDESVLGPAQQIVEKRGKSVPKGVQDIRRLLEDKHLDAVSIATPNHWHALAAIWAMQAGKDVYIEKPVSHNVSEGRRIVEAARRYGRICQTGTQIRSSKGSQEAIAYIHSGKIGRVTLARGLCYKRRDSIGHKADGPVPPGVNYDIWLGPAPTRPFNPNRFHYNWHWNWDYGNGDVGNQGIHQMDVARWALDKHTLPTRVMGLGGRFGYEDDGETPNTELAFYDYGDKHLIFEVRGLKTDPLKGAKVGNIVYGTEGYVVFTDYDTALAFDNKDTQVAEFKGGGDHFGNFLDAVRSRKPSDLHAEILEGHLSSALCHLGNISYRLGSPQPFDAKTKTFGDDKEAYETFGRFEQHLEENGIRLQETTYRLGPTLQFDPKSERFPENESANALLTRAYRAPFVVPERI